jgi:hypothetical protein
VKHFTSRAIGVAVAAAALSASAALAAASTGPSMSPPAGKPAAAPLVGLWQAQFTAGDEQTSGTWHLRIGPGHSLKIWNRLDPVAHSPSFEAGPVSFQGDRMIFAKTTAGRICTVGAIYRWTLSRGLLRFRQLGADGCHPRAITFTPHPWHRSS